MLKACKSRVKTEPDRTLTNYLRPRESQTTTPDYNSGGGVIQTRYFIDRALKYLTADIGRSYRGCAGIDDLPFRGQVGLEQLVPR